MATFLRRLISRSELIRNDDMFSRMLGHPLTAFVTIAGTLYFKSILWHEPLETLTVVQSILFILLWVPGTLLSAIWLVVAMGKSRLVPDNEYFAPIPLFGWELLVLITSLACLVTPNLGRDEKPASLSDFKACITRIEHHAGYRELALRVHDKNPLTKGGWSAACREAKAVSQAHLPKPPASLEELMAKYGPSTEGSMDVVGNKVAYSVSRLKDDSGNISTSDFNRCVKYIYHEAGYKVLARRLASQAVVTKDNFDDACESAQVAAIWNSPRRPQTLEELLERYGPGADLNSAANKLIGDVEDEAAAAEAPAP